nr:zinc finger BED domain-containing protein RICESLEEPER 3-like [Quercus suber]
METPTNEPSVQTPAATENDGAIPTQVEASAATQSEAAAASELPPIPPCQVSMIAPVSGTCSGRKKSIVWGHFEKVKIGEGDTSKTKAICNYCQKSYNVDSKTSGTSNLLAHVLICPKNPNRDDLVKGQKTLAFEPKKDGEDGFHLVSTSFSVEACRKALAEMIIIDELPFRYVEGYGFKKYVTTLQPKLRLKDIPSRQTVARDVIGIYNSEREKLRKSLKGCRVCLTTNTWTSIQNLNYMCLTCHFIDDAWKLHKRIINFCQVEDHKRETIGRKIEMSLREWGIDGIFTLTVDNASSNLTTIKFLQRVTKDWNGTVLGNKYMHMRCCAHILNLIVGEGLKEIDASVAKVREAVRKDRYILIKTFYLFLQLLEKVQLASNKLDDEAKEWWEEIQIDRKRRGQNQNYHCQVHASSKGKSFRVEKEQPISGETFVVVKKGQDLQQVVELKLEKKIELIVEDHRNQEIVIIENNVKDPLGVKGEDESITHNP